MPDGGCTGAVRRLPVGSTFPTRRSSKRSAPTWPTRSCARRIWTRRARKDLVALLRARASGSWGYRNKLELGARTARERSLHAGLLSRRAHTTWRRPTPARSRTRTSRGRPRRCAARCGSRRERRTWASSGWACGGSVRTSDVEVALWTPPGALPPRARGGDGQERPQGHERRARAGRSRQGARQIKGVEALEGTRLVGRAGGRRAAAWPRAPSFFQVNTAQAEMPGRRRAGRAREGRTALSRRLLVADLYAGGGHVLGAARPWPART